jgi:hypothetical protein
VPPDCPVHQAEQRLSAQRSTTQWPDRATVRDRSQSRRERRTGHWTVAVRCGTGLSGAPRCQSSNSRNHQNPNGWVTWLAHRTSQLLSKSLSNATYIRLKHWQVNSIRTSGETRANIRGVHLPCKCIRMRCGRCLYGEKLNTITNFWNFRGCTCTHWLHSSFAPN